MKKIFLITSLLIVTSGTFAKTNLGQDYDSVGGDKGPCCMNDKCPPSVVKCKHTVTTDRAVIDKTSVVTKRRKGKDKTSDQ